MQNIETMKHSHEIIETRKKPIEFKSGREERRERRKKQRQNK